MKRIRETLTREEVIQAIKETEAEMLNKAYVYLHPSVLKAVRIVTPATLRVLRAILRERYPEEG